MHDHVTTHAAATCTHTQLAQHSTQLAQAYTCSPTTKVGKKTATTITQLCNYTSQSAHTTKIPLVACCCWWAWKSSAAEARLWVWKSLVPETGFGKAQGVGKSPLNWKVLEKMDQPEGPPNKKGRKSWDHFPGQEGKEEGDAVVSLGKGRPN